MKMSEVFDLPMDVSNQDREPMLGDKNYYISSFCDILTYQDGKGIKRAEAAALAINCHDELVEALEELLFLCEGEKNPPKEVIRARAALAKARGEK
tara:strand:- start:13265 stop:13552 length:288 start_codon:yes stop_codon:yes gene_type:complete